MRCGGRGGVRSARRSPPGAARRSGRCIGRLLAAGRRAADAVAERLPQVYGRFRALLVERLASARTTLAARRATRPSRGSAPHGIRVALTTGFDRALVETHPRGGRLGAPARRLGLRRRRAAGRPAPFMIFRAMERCGVADVHRRRGRGRHAARSRGRLERRRGLAHRRAHRRARPGDARRGPAHPLLDSVAELPALWFET